MAARPAVEHWPVLPPVITWRLDEASPPAGEFEADESYFGGRRKGKLGHGGADNRTIRAFLDFLDDPENTPRTTVEEGWQAMVTCCAADQSAREHRTVELDELRRLL